MKNINNNNNNKTDFPFKAHTKFTKYPVNNVPHEKKKNTGKTSGNSKERRDNH